MRAICLGIKRRPLSMPGQGTLSICVALIRAGAAGAATAADPNMQRLGATRWRQTVYTHRDRLNRCGCCALAAARRLRCLDFGGSVVYCTLRPRIDARLRSRGGSRNGCAAAEQQQQQQCRNLLWHLASTSLLRML